MYKHQISYRGDSYSRESCGGGGRGGREGRGGRGGRGGGGGGY